MLILQSSQLIARGWHRECYEHPQDAKRCVKVVVNGNDAETRREQAYYRFLEKRLKNWHSVPRFHGNVATNLGDGAVFDLVRDADGKVSRTLADYLDHEADFRHHAPALLSAMESLLTYQLENNVLTMSLKPYNLLFQLEADGKGSMQIIDNLGNADWIPLCNYSPFFGRRKIKRKWKKFLAMLKRDYADRQDILAMLSRIASQL